MFESIKISPSILSANFMDMQSDIDLIEQAGAGYVHVDVMDGHFVPNLTMGVPLVKQLKKATRLPLDVHLMIDNPSTQIPWFIEAGADIITFHIEAVPEAADQIALIKTIKAAGVKAAASIKPKTSTSTLEPIIELLDMALVMSVEPGFSGQSYIEGSELKIAEIAAMAKSHGVNPLIEVDGGIGEATVARVCAAGADVLVCGNAVYAAEDPAGAIQRITKLGEAAVCKASTEQR